MTDRAVMPGTHLQIFRKPVMRLAPTLLFLALSAATAARAEDTPAYEIACRQWAKVEVPTQDAGTATAGCDSRRLYYGQDGEGLKLDYVAARHCAYAERAASRDKHSPFGGSDTAFGGSGTLMMLYANGQGVKRNLALAKRFACEYGGAPMEVEGRLHHLDEIAKGADRASFDLCDDITSGMMMGFCAGRDGDFAAIRRDRRWTALQSSWTPTQREALATLRDKAKAYFDDVSREETDMSGTMRGVFATGAFEALDRTLLDDIVRFEAGERPVQKASDFASADKALNDQYRETMAKLDAGKGPNGFGDYGTIMPDGVRTTQRSWLLYRDAWVRFVAVRWPKTPADTWKAWLTIERTRALRALVQAP